MMSVSADELRSKNCKSMTTVFPFELFVSISSGVIVLTLHPPPDGSETI
jgi:hypothetical protein